MELGKEYGDGFHEIRFLVTPFVTKRRQELLVQTLAANND